MLGGKKETAGVHVKHYVLTNETGTQLLRAFLQDSFIPDISTDMPTILILVEFSHFSGLIPPF